MRGTVSCLFLLLAILHPLGLGLALWSRVRFRTANPFFLPCFVLAAGLGASMLGLWLLYAFGLYNRMVLLLFLVSPLALLRPMFRRFSGVRASPEHEATTSRAPLPVRLMDTATLFVLVLFLAGLARCTFGPFTAWDAAVSWDKWAEDIARRSFLGGYVSGGYPPGIPLLVSVLYKFLVPVGTPAVATNAQLFASLFFLVFPLLLGLSLLSAARSLRLPSPWCFAIVFGNAAAIHCMLKFHGYVDIPIAAFTAAAAAWFCEIHTRHEPPRPLADVVLLFPVVFTKGNGFLFLAVALGLALLFDRSLLRQHGKAALAALLLGGAFYLHQWIAGVWCPSLSETRATQHALVVMSSHKDLVTPDWPHFLSFIDNWGFFYGVRFPALARLLLAGTSLILLAAIRPRASRLPALLTLIAFGLTFRAGSYDARNAMFLLVPVALLVPATLLAPAKRLAGRRATAYNTTVSALAILLGLHALADSRLPDIASRAFRTTPRQTAQQDPPGTHADAFLTQSGLGRRAAHVLSASTAYRRLPHGVYPLQQNAHNGLRPHDLAFQSKNSGKTAAYTPRSSFLPVAESTDREFGFALYLNEPTRVPILCVQDADEPGRFFFHLEDLPEEARESGVLEVSLHTDAPVLLKSRDTPLPFRPWVERSAPHQTLRLPYWVDNGQPPRFILESPVPLIDSFDTQVLY